MKDKQAKALAIVALVFMAIFLAALMAAIADPSLFNGGIGYVALATGCFTFVIFLALKADGRGFSITKMNNEAELERLKAQEKENAESDETDESDESDAAAQSETDGNSEIKSEPKKKENADESEEPQKDEKTDKKD